MTRRHKMNFDTPLGFFFPFCLHGWHFSTTWPQLDQNDRMRRASSVLSKYAQPMSQEFRELLQRLEPRLGMRRNSLRGGRGRGKKTSLLTLFSMFFPLPPNISAPFFCFCKKRAAVAPWPSENMAEQATLLLIIKFSGWSATNQPSSGINGWF